MDDFLKKLAKAFEDENSAELREVSNKAIEEALITEKADLVDISMVAYALSKLVTKPHLLRSNRWKAFKKQVLQHFEQVSRKQLLDKIMEDVSEFDKNQGNYLQGIVKKGRIKQASRAYALGLSLGRAASLTNVSQGELSKYIGKTKIHERPFVKSKSVRERYKAAKDVLE